MNKLREWWLKRRRSRALKKINKLRRKVEPIGRLKQIIYLDAVALRSLYISRYGPEDARITITNSKTRDAELGGSVGISPSGVGSAGLGGQFKRSTEKAIQVERISSEQSLLKDLLDRESIQGGGSEFWDATILSDRMTSTDQIKLHRGTMVQIRIRLQADITFRISSLADSIAKLAESSPDVVLSGPSEMLQIADILRQLLLEQAPIDAELTDWGFSPDQRALVPVSEASFPVRLAALTEIENYWIDVRRALFDNAECTALIRVSEDFPSSKWSPVKLFDAVRGIPGFGDVEASIAKVTNMLNTAVAAPPPQSNSFTPALQHYAGKRCPIHIHDVISKQIPRIAEQYQTTSDIATEFDKALDEIDELARLESISAEDPDELGRWRSEALGLVTSFEQQSFDSYDENNAVAESPRYLVGEVIALYW